MEDTVKKLEQMFEKAEADIDVVSKKVDNECENFTAGTNQVNPAEVLQRLSNIKTEYSSIVKDAKAIQEAQKEAMVFFREQIGGLCTTLTKLQNTTGLGEPEKPVELQQFEKLFGIQTSESVPVEGSADESSCQTQTIKPPLPVVFSGENSSTQEAAEGNGVEFKLGAFERRANSQSLIEIDQEEFDSVSAFVRGRVKLTDVNETYKKLWRIFKVEKRKAPLTPADMYSIGLKVTGQTGEAKLKVLKSLKLLSRTRDGKVSLL